MNAAQIRREDWIVGGLALLLLIDLVAFPWFSLGTGPFTFDLTATDAPDGWLGILAVIAAVALIAYIAVDRLSPQTQLPALGNSRGLTRLVLAGAVVGFMVLKFLLHIHFSYFGWGFWLAIPLAAALLYFAMQMRTTESATQGGTAPPTPPPATGGPPPPTTPAV